MRATGGLLIALFVVFMFLLGYTSVPEPAAVPEPDIIGVQISESRLMMVEFMYRAEHHIAKYEETGDAPELELAITAANVAKQAAMSQSETDIMNIWKKEFDARVQGRVQIAEAGSR